MTNRAPVAPIDLALAGMASLAAAMGIGRFAFTPMLPLMLREGQLDVALGGWVAAANYLGYLVGALTAARIRWSAAGLGAAALGATALLTAAMAWPSVPLWLLLRFLAGVASAWVFVATSVWCLGGLARQGRPELAGLVYAGVGVGIATAGAYVLGAKSAGASAAQLWVQLGALALVFFACIVPVLWRTRDAVAGAPPAPPVTAATGGAWGLVACYGIMGFGYILPATFLPVMARSVVDDPRLFGLAWPVFGATAAVSTVLSGTWLRRLPRLKVWAVSQAAMGVGVLLPSLWLSAWTIAVSALLVGGTFMVITLAGVQEMRARAPANPAALVGRITAAFAAGQIAGPVLSSVLLLMPGLAARALPLALQVAGLALLASAAWLARPHPQPGSQEEVPHAR